MENVSEEKPKKEWHGPGYPQYDETIHIPLIHEIFESLEGVAGFCAKAEISRQTFNKWVHKYPEFKENYEIAINKGAVLWEKKLLELAERGIALNFNYWNAINRNRYKASSIRLEKEKEDTTAARMAAAWISMQQGGITPQEYNQIAAGLSTESKVSEVELQRQIITQLQKSAEDRKEMTDEALKAYMLVKNGKGRVVENVEP